MVDSVFSPKPQRKGPGDPGPSLKELFAETCLSRGSPFLPASFFAGHSAWQHPHSSSPGAWWWQLLTICFKTSRKLPILESYTVTNFPLLKHIFNCTTLSHFSVWKSGIKEQHSELCSLQVRRRVRHRAVDEGSGCHLGILPEPLSRGRGRTCLHTQCKCSELAQVLWKTHPGFKRLLLHQTYSSSLDLLSLCQLYASLQMYSKVFMWFHTVNIYS